MKFTLTNAEYAVLGLLMEKPRHGYDLEQVVQERGMRNWTELAFSSIYFILKKLEKRNLARSERDPDKSTRKLFRPTQEGRDVFQTATLEALAQPHMLYPTVLLGLSNWPFAVSGECLNALEARQDALRGKLAEVEQAAAFAPTGMPHVAALFDYSTSQLSSELDWLERTMKRLGDHNGQD